MQVKKTSRRGVWVFSGTAQCIKINGLYMYLFSFVLSKSLAIILFRDFFMGVALYYSKLLSISLW